MMTSTELLPAEIRSSLATGDVLGAGEQLLRHGEELARRSPGRALDWARRLSSVATAPPLLAAYGRWTSGVVGHLAGDIPWAEGELRAAARQMSRLGRGDLADRTRLLVLDLYGEQLKLDKARRLARHLRSRLVARGDVRRAAVVLANLACAEDAADRVARARDLWRRARRDLEAGSLPALLVRANLANVAAESGDLDRAIAEHGMVADAARTLGFDALALQAELNRAEAEFSAGLVDVALKRWSMVLAESRREAAPLLEATATLDLARAEMELGDLTTALARVEDALPDLERRGMEVERLRALRLVGVLHARRGDRSRLDSALQSLDRSGARVQRDLLVVETAEAGAGVDPEEVWASARRLEREGLRRRATVGRAWAARRAFEAGDDRAPGWAREVLASRRATPWARMVAHHVLGRSGMALRARHLSRAVRLADRLQGRLCAASDRAAFLSLCSDVYLDRIEELLRRGTARDRRRALNLVTRFQAAWLADELTRRADRGTDPVIRRWQALRRRLALLLEEIEGDAEPRMRRAGLGLDARLRDIERGIQEVELELSRRWPELVPDASGDVVERLADHLPPGHLFMEVLLARDVLTVFLLSRERLEVRRVLGVGDEVRQLQQSVAFHVDAYSMLGGRNDRATRGLSHRLARLGEMLLSDLPERGWDLLWLAPHGTLHGLLWPAVPVRGRVLADHGDVALVPGAPSVLGLLAADPPRPRTVAIHGAPHDSLPGVAREVEELARLMPGSKVVHRSSREEFLRDLAERDLVHLAGHAVFLDDLPGASGLKLSDGYVTVHDLAATRAAARMVTFGVCSGVRLGQAGHRVDGFLRALVGGGVRTVVGPFAPVRDEVAHRFDSVLYRALMSGEGPGGAYRRAVRAVRELDDHPAGWGSFHLYGDPRPWRSR